MSLQVKDQATLSSFIITGYNNNPIVDLSAFRRRDVGHVSLNQEVRGYFRKLALYNTAFFSNARRPIRVAKRM